MWNQIKGYLAKGIFRKEYTQLNFEKKLLKLQTDTTQRQIDEWDKRVADVSLTDLVREQLKGFDFRKVKGDLLSEIPPDQLVSYLEEALTIMEGNVFPYVVEYARRNQIDETIHEANSLEHVNFGRATLSGISLIEEAMESLVTEYDERHKTQEPFDKHSAT